MTKISLNKIPYEGPKTHNQILEQVRADLAKTHNSISRERAELIVSSFFSRKVLFKNILKKEIIWSPVIGRFMPGRMPVKIKRIRAMKKKKYEAAKKYLEQKEKQRVVNMRLMILRRYKKWFASRVARNLHTLPLEKYMYYKHLTFPGKRKVTREIVKQVLYRFSDDGVLVIKRRSKAMRAHYAQLNSEKKAKEALENQD